MIFLVIGAVLSVANGVERFPKIIWTYSEGEDGLITQLCIQNMNRTAKREGWQFKVLNPKTYLTFITDKHRFNNMISHSSVSKTDIMRLFILHQHGGVWADANTFFTQQFNWISRIEHQTTVENKFGQHPDALLFSSSQQMRDRRIQLIEGTQNSKVRICPQNEMWFIAALPGAPIIKDWLSQLQRYILDGMPYGGYIGNYGPMAFHAVIQERQHNLTAIDSNQQYAVQDYKVWTIQSRLAGYHINYFTNYNEQNAIKYLLQYTESEIKEIMGLPRYFITMDSGFISNMDTAIVRTQQKYQKASFWFKLMHIFDQVHLSCQMDLHLPYQFIVKDSLIDKYLLQQSENPKAKIMTYSKQQIKNKCSIDYVFYILVAIMSIPFWPVVLFSLYCFVVRPIKWISRIYSEREYKLVEHNGDNRMSIE